MFDKLKGYLNGDGSNRLLKSVKHDFNVLEYVAGIKALGLVSFLVRTPLWCFIEDKTIHILDSSAYYQEAITFLNESVVNAQDFIEGKRLSFCDEQRLQSDAIFKKLIEPWEHDDKVIKCYIHYYLVFVRQRKNFLQILLRMASGPMLD